MSTLIYYFTGTGNSLAIAQKIAAALDDCRLIPIARAINESQAEVGNRIGFVFPTYAYGLPMIVKEFLKKTSFNQNAYFFAVASNFGIPGTILYQADKLLKKHKCRLDAGFAVLDERSSLIDDPQDMIQRLMISVNRGQKPRPSTERLDEIIRTVKAKSHHDLERSNRLTNFFGTLLYSMAIGTFKSMAKNFWVMESCISCGTCAMVCPKKNIVLIEGKPVWENNCELCHACIQWCSQSAIQFKNLTESKSRYRNPDISVKDMVHQSTKVK
jgi:ferredoxin/flavodoxin